MIDMDLNIVQFVEHLWGLLHLEFVKYLVQQFLLLHLFYLLQQFLVVLMLIEVLLEYQED
ncbi:MAG: hypothetical protein CMF74_02985 [Maricaulis sp.]|nr:hypothetical protein [Maricaulis sp.]